MLTAESNRLLQRERELGNGTRFTVSAWCPRWELFHGRIFILNLCYCCSWPLHSKAFILILHPLEWPILIYNLPGRTMGQSFVNISAKLCVYTNMIDGPNPNHDFFPNLAQSHHKTFLTVLEGINKRCHPVNTGVKASDQITLKCAMDYWHISLLDSEDWPSSILSEIKIRVLLTLKGKM